MKLASAKEIAVISVTNEVAQEVLRAVSMFSPMASPHEAYGVIAEEFEEYWDEVKAFNPRKNRDTRPRQREELIQLAAMAVRAVLDTVDFGKVYNVPDSTTPVVEPPGGKAV